MELLWHALHSEVVDRQREAVAIEVNICYGYAGLSVLTGTY